MPLAVDVQVLDETPFVLEETMKSGCESLVSTVNFEVELVDRVATEELFKKEKGELYGKPGTRVVGCGHDAQMRSRVDQVGVEDLGEPENLTVRIIAHDAHAREERATPELSLEMLRRPIGSTRPPELTHAYVAHDAL